MKVLFDIVHPADVHFFKHSIASLLQRGDEVIITSREKDITVELLDTLGMKHSTISRLGKGPLGLFTELITREIALWKIAKTFTPDIYVSNNSPCAAHIAWLMRRPSIVFDDTETNRYHRRLYYPVVTQIHSPNCYRSSLGAKQCFYPGYHALAYLHPNHFSPDPQVLQRSGLDPAEPMVLLRFVGWGALHDVGRKRLKPEDKHRIVRLAKKYGRVLISSELPLPDDLESYRLQLSVAEIHHLLYYIKLLVSDSGSMTSEAVVLGAPAIYCDDVGLGYTDEQQEKYGLCFNVKPDDIEAILETITKLMTSDDTRQHFAEARARLLHDKIDVASYQLEQIDRLGIPPLRGASGV
jgi:predicted glycosyltransferase